eukprot:scaffold668875_cov59-Prasinocladus_malaysianus.AAC.1
MNCDTGHQYKFNLIKNYVVAIQDTSRMSRFRIYGGSTGGSHRLNVLARAEEKKALYDIDVVAIMYRFPKRSLCGVKCLLSVGANFFGR